ncbi:MAG: diguanylate cyclase domain-containing protein [Halanaerobium sp.]
MADIYVVEDSKLDQAVIKKVLINLEYKAEYFSKAEAVIEVMNNLEKDNLPKLILIDIVLAGEISGYQLAEKLKKKYDIPIIFLIASDNKKDLTQKLLNGDLFLNKPINSNELKNNIKIMIEKNKIDSLIENRINENIVKNLEQQIWYYKDPYTYKMVNQSYALFLGKKETELVNKYIYDILPPKTAEEVIAENIEVFLQKKVFKKEKWYKNSNGENRLLSIKKTPIFNKDGNVENIFCEAEDITEQNILENELRSNRDNLQQIIEAVPDIIFLINEDGDILDLWTGDQSKLLYPKKEALGKNIKALLSKKSYNICKNKIRELINQKKIVTFEYSLLIDNYKKYYEAKMLNLKSFQKQQRIIVSVRDISERKENSLKLEKLSREYETILSNVENEMERLDSSRKLPIAVMIADLDNLKYINDNYGHQEGDNYITTAAEMISDSTRDEDIVARIGGDEFALILPDTNFDGAQKIYQRIKEKQHQYLKENDKIEIFSISIGYSIKNHKDSPLEEVFKSADKKMYKNKEKNKNK